ncbi:O-antigen ligase family protein [Pseudoalteromonas arabiensis]|uniref:O-antigen ligase family protein n=1 Tax=Pseudoalteromonas arabiensis TaxID=874454 RepID=UPI000785D576|nr:hypothetical protein [Pseudoalteromonas arabiensis]
MFNIASFFYCYIVLLVLGPLIYISKLPLASYHFAFLALLFLVFLNQLKYRNTIFYFPIYLKCYFSLLVTYLFTYAFNFFEPAYVANIRDLIIIFAPAQYMLLVFITYLAFKYCFDKKEDDNFFFFRLIRLNVCIMPIVGLIALFQIFNVFGIQDILAKYYGKANVEVWRQYFIYNPRASSTINLEPNSLALYCAFSLAMFHVFYNELKMSKFKSFAVYILGVLGLILSGSFTGFIIYILVSSMYFFKYKKIGVKFIVVISVLSLLFGLMFSDNIESAIKRQKLDQGNLVPSSFNARIENAWSKAYISFEDEFINGIGPSAVQLDYSTDNDFLDKFLRFGLIGGLGNVFFILFLISYPLFKRKNVSDLFIKKLYFYSFMLACCFALASITGSAFKAKRLAELFWIYYSLPFIFTYVLNKKAIYNEK